MKRSSVILAVLLVLCIMLSMSACTLPEPIAGLLGGSADMAMEDITVEYGKTYQLKTEMTVSTLTGEKTLPIEYSYAGKNITVDENGLLTAKVAETVTEVTATCGNLTAVFTVTVTLPSASGNDTHECTHTYENGVCTGCGEADPDYVPPHSHTFENGVCTGCGEADPDYVPPHTHSFEHGTCTGCGEKDPNYVPTPEEIGTMKINAPSSIYTNYPGKEISVTFSSTWFDAQVTFTTDNANVFVENGKIFAKGNFESAVNVTVTATTEYHTATATVKVSTYTGGVNAETKVQYYEENIIKEENKGGIIFVGDSYFDGYQMTEPPFWKDFYKDFLDEKAFLMGISSSQIDDLEIVSERLVYPMEPSEIVVHIGFNDVHHGPLTTDELIARITALLTEYHTRLPEAKIYFMGVEPKKNGYTEGDQYYNSSTVKAPAVTAAMKALAEANDWLVYVDTLSIFVNADGTVNKSMYLSTDLSHPTLEAYDLIRVALNKERIKFDPYAGTATIIAPESIYTNYAGKDIRLSFSNPKFSFLDVTYTTNNANVFVENGKIFAKGDFASAVMVTVTATTKYHTATCTVKVSTYTANKNIENKVQYYEQNIIKDENKGGIIFVGDSYFDGYQMSEPPFWKDFYQDFAGQKAFLMGISQSQIDNLEIVSERLVYPMQPSEIVVHIGFNDVHHGPLTTDELIARITALLTEYHTRLPGAKIYFMGVEPKKNGYTEGTSYYESSTVKAPAVTAAMKAFAEKNDWLVFLDTNSIFIKADGTIDQSMYLSADLSHPTLAAYDLIRLKLEECRDLKESLTINNYGVSTDVNGKGKYFTDSTGNNLTDNFIISGKLYFSEFVKSNAHIQFRFGSNSRFVLWDQSNDGKFGAGYINAGVNVSDKNSGVTLYDANSGLMLEWAVIVKDGEAYWYINGELKQKLDSPQLQYFNIGALQINVTFYDMELYVKADDEDGYKTAIAAYGFVDAPTEPDGGDEGGSDDEVTGGIALDDIVLSYYEGAVLTNSKYIKYNDQDIVADYVISGKLDVTQLGQNAHLQFRFNGEYRFLIWDSNADKTYGVGWEENNAHKNETQSNSLTFKFDASGTNTLEWTIVMTDNEAYFYINGTLVKKFTSFATTRQHLNIGASYFGAELYDMTFIVKSADPDAYAAKLASLGITY